MQDQAGYLFRCDALLPIRVDLLRKLRGSADKFSLIFQKDREKNCDPVLQQLRLRFAVRDQLPHIVSVPLQFQLPVFDVPADAGELCPAAAPLFLHQSETGIYRPADGGGAGDPVEHILCLLFSQVVDQQDRKIQPVRQAFQNGQIPVVIGVGGVMDGPDHLQCVDDDQHRSGMLRHEGFDLLFQPLSDGSALRAEVDAVWRVLSDLEQSILNAEDRVLQAEIEGGTLFGGHVPDRFSLGYGHCQPEGQPRFPHLWGAGQDVQTFGEQPAYHEVRRAQRLAHQGLAIHGVKLRDVGFHVVDLLAPNMKKAPTAVSALKRRIFLLLDYSPDFDKM